MDRESLGRIVREEWMRWAGEQPNPSPHWLSPWEALPEAMREVDRRIGDAVQTAVVTSLTQEINALRDAVANLTRERDALHVLTADAHDRVAFPKDGDDPVSIALAALEVIALLTRDNFDGHPSDLEGLARREGQR